MKRRNGFRATALLAAMTFSTACLAADIEHQTDYSIALAGLPLARATFHTELVKNRYTISGTLNSAGLIDIISRTSGQTRVSGVIANDHLRASQYSMSYRSGRKSRAISVTFRNGNVVRASMTPKRTPLPKNWVPVTSRDMRNVLDPLSGLIIPGKSRVCPNTLPIFDGESRLDIRLSPKGTRSFKTRGFNGEVIVCGVRFVPKAGYRKGREDVEYLRRLETMEIWFARAEAVDVYAPVYVRIPTKLGPVTVSATRFGG
ncbi:MULTISPECIES: DUF3108 domain-containing protein [unclassified Sinorhizobium]|uniref:DUF3108 domain-containing protein n=1 Tax=unclassified Sinorhizobium TaxID=2613772 RepID=UPI0024C3086F|nr:MULTISPECIES: DUF3108 domain-containing protein [unclassified Sinorhizobium]MDK1375154.1 DUF3108 domain-containing protein [Sinorhizobium sp. 6-70]MDK1480793.1 DUF3108 domain-containing protein [Sinorhizobium sp. 6-117]